MRVVWAGLGVVAAMAWGGCGGGAPALRSGVETGKGPGGAGGGDSERAGSASDGGIDGPAPGDGSSPVAGPGAPCPALALSASITLAPAAPGQSYFRCDTLGPEAGWRVTLSPAGNRLAALTGAGTVRLIATDNWSEIAQLGSPLGRIDAVEFSPDGALLATLSSEMGEVVLWSTMDGALRRTFVGPPTSGVDTTASSLTFSSDGHRLATSLGTIIDLDAGGILSWLTGQPEIVVLGINPENLSFSSLSGGAVPRIRFTASDALLFVETDYAVGNSPPSTRLELRNPATGQAVVSMFDMFTRALLGFAVSPDGRYVALGRTPEAAVAGFPPGLFVYDATNGVEVVSDSTFTGTVLGFSPDGARLFTRTATTVAVVGSTDLHSGAEFTWPADVAFLGISPGGELVGSVGGATSWWDPMTGRIVRTSSYPLTAATWSVNGRFGAGTGETGTLFHFWREADNGQLCAPRAGEGTAPLLASLGTPGPTAEGGTAASADGSLIVTAAFVVHTHATNYDALGVFDSATGTLLRQFGAVIGVEPISISIPSGDRLYTSEGPDVAVWCR